MRLTAWMKGAIIGFGSIQLSILLLGGTLNVSSQVNLMTFTVGPLAIGTILGYILDKYMR